MLPNNSISRHWDRKFKKGKKTREMKSINQSHGFFTFTHFLKVIFMENISKSCTFLIWLHELFLPGLLFKFSNLLWIICKKIFFFSWNRYSSKKFLINVSMADVPSSISNMVRSSLTNLKKKWCSAHFNPRGEKKNVFNKGNTYSIR